MNRKSLILIAAVVAGAIGLGSYYVGFLHGKAAMDGFAGNLVNGVNASVRVESLQVMAHALTDLKESRPAEAEAKIARFAKFQAKAVAECSRSPECSSLAGRPLPSTAELAASGIPQ
jgi:hypothetical protein